MWQAQLAAGALLFALLWGVNGYAQSMGAPASVVGLARWFNNRERGTYYGVWCTSHNLGEALTFILTSLVVCFVVSLVTPAPSEEIEAEFEAAK